MGKFLRMSVLAIVLFAQLLTGVNVGVSAEATNDEVNNITALSLLTAAEKVEIEESSWGPMITAINGLKAAPPYFWAFYVNNDEASVGAGDYIPEVGDQLSFRYTSWEDTSNTYTTEETIKVVGLSSNSTALSLLQEAETIEVEESQWGPMIKAINGLREAGTYYWAFYVNGAEASVGAHSYKPKAGDALTFKYTSWAGEPDKVQPSSKITIAALPIGEPPLNEGTKPNIQCNQLPEGTPIEKAVKWVQCNNNTPTLEEVLAFRQIGQPVPKSYIENIEKSVNATSGNFTSVTDLEKAALGLILSDKDPTNFNGINVIEKIYNNKNLTMQGINGVIYGLITLDSKNFPVPSNAEWTREKLIKHIINNQLSSGGWALNGSTADIDITAMTLSSLAKYQNQQNVKATIDKAIQFLKNSQQQSGGFLSINGQENSQSSAQVIIALSTLGINPEGFTKQNSNVHSALLLFQNNDGGFSNLNGRNSELVSTGQGLLALISYERFEKGKSSVYDLSALPPLVVGERGGNGSGGSFPTPPGDGKKQTITITVRSHQSTILSTSTMEVSSGTTALSALLDALGSRVETSGYGSTAYVIAIDALAEFQHGPTSGWKYSVNGYFPSSSAGSYSLNNGDSLEWVYVLKDDEAAKEKAAMSGNVQNTRPEAVSIAVFDSLESIKANSQKLNVILNKEQKMLAGEAQKLKEALQANIVKLEKSVIPTEETVITGPTVDEAKIIIPKEALKEQKTIKIEELDASANKDSQVKSPIYQFFPNGIKFEKPVYISITIPIENDDLDYFVMAWFDEEEKQWLPIPTVIDAKTGIVTGMVDHFTKFAVISKSAENKLDITAEMNQLIRYLQEDQTQSEWEDFGLARLNLADKKAVIAGIIKKLTEANGDFRKITDYERYALTVHALDGNPTSIGGYDLIEKIYNNERMTLQGTNGLIFALIALDSGHYQVPSNAKWNREKILAEILTNQNKDGGFSLVNGEASDVDITAMAISSLANYKEMENVSSAIDKAINWLSSVQQGSGGFIADGAENSESAAQVIIALTSVGIDPQGSLFTKAKGNVISNLLSYQTKDGGFANLKNEASNQIASEQALLALIALDRFNNSMGSIYLFTNEEKAKEAVKSIPVFADEKQISSYALQSIYEAFDKEIMYGVEKEPLKFAPLEPLTRAQFTAILVKLLEGEAYEQNNIIFEDVKPGQWYYSVVMRGHQLGIISGTSATTFNPNEAITREQVAVILARAFQLVQKQEASKTIIYKDIANLSQYNQVAIEALYDHNLMKGYEGGLFKPNDLVTREMGAVLAVRIAEKF
ncbi:MAG TPA: DUF4430 domain-containing protein [Bacillus bacterium]|nr:DUF4430 domain-containing protein [Bacillus sp. (in: firmicutes)]